MTYIEIYGKGRVQILDQLPQAVRATVLGISRGWWKESRVYASDGGLWSVAPTDPAAVRISSVSRLLALTVYNPIRAVAMKSEKTGTYALEELKAAIKASVERDDDILTQFMTAENIMIALERATDFDAIVRLLKRMRRAA